jgi:Txe/YoeB family toxin of Txe-Axe toxin-antitoxin module
LYEAKTDKEVEEKINKIIDEINIYRALKLQQYEKAEKAIRDYYEKIKEKVEKLNEIVYGNDGDNIYTYHKLTEEIKKETKVYADALVEYKIQTDPELRLKIEEYVEKKTNKLIKEKEEE